MASVASPLTARCDITCSEPSVLMGKLHDYFAEFGCVHLSGQTCSIETGFGLARLECGRRSLHLEASGADETALAYVKLAMAEQLLTICAGMGATPEISWTGDGAAGQPLPYFREMRVVHAHSITPRMRRVRLAGSSLSRFAQGGLHVQLFFPGTPFGGPIWPVMGRDGRPMWPTGRKAPPARTYTIRNIDVSRGEADIDFVLHDGDDTPGATFASRAVPGDIVGMAGPVGGTIACADTYLLLGDETALPAIGRILEMLPNTAHATVIVEVADEGERQVLGSVADIDLRWLFRDGREPGTTTVLCDAVRPLRKPIGSERYFAWAACEQKASREIRRHMRHVMGLTRAEHLCAAYWRRDIETCDGVGTIGRLEE